MNIESICVGGAPADAFGVCSEHGESACVIQVVVSTGSTNEVVASGAQPAAV